jgi:hypothetical protein
MRKGCRQRRPFYFFAAEFTNGYHRRMLTKLLLLCLLPGATSAAVINSETSLFRENAGQMDEENTLQADQEIDWLEQKPREANAGWVHVKAGEQEGWIRKEAVGVDEDEKYEWDLLTRSRVHLFAAPGFAKELTSSAKSIAIAFGADLFIKKFPLVPSLYFTSYRPTYGVTKGTRSSTLLGLSYFITPVFYVRGFLGNQQADFDGYTSENNKGTQGAALGFRHNIDRKWDLSLEANWQHLPADSLRKDSGVPVTNSEALNTFCTIFTFGLANGCGNQSLRTSIPAANVLTIYAKLGIYFFL